MNINLLDELALKELMTLIASSSNIVVCGHKSPDGDAVGSTLAWAATLRSLGKTATVILPDATPDFLQWLPGFAASLRYDKNKEAADKALADADLVCYLDFSETSRTGNDMQKALDATTSKLLLIDHHIQQEGSSCHHADVAVIEPEKSSTSEIIFRLLWQMGLYGAMTKEVAECIYCGMMTDTGGFTYNSTDAAIFFIISQLLEKAVDKDEIYNRVFHNYSAFAVRFRAYLIYHKLHIVDDLHASYYAVSKSNMKRFHFHKGDLEGLVNEPLRIKGHKLSISLREDTDHPNTVYCSLRSSCGFHCQPMAVRFFNGGGHADASGGTLHCSLDEAEKIAAKAIEAFRDELK